MADLLAAVRPRRVIQPGGLCGGALLDRKPAADIQSNLGGFSHILEGCCHHGDEHFVDASSSSVYGCNRNLPTR